MLLRWSALNTVRHPPTLIYADLTLGWTHPRPHIPNCLVLVVSHTNCGGAAACQKAVTAGIPPPEPTTTPFARWLALLTTLAGMLNLQGVPDSEALTKMTWVTFAQVTTAELRTKDLE